MRPQILALLAALALLATACPEEPADPEEPDQPAEAPEEPPEDEALPEEAPEPEEEPDDVDDAPAIDLPEGVAASVNGEEISSARIEERIDAGIEAQPELADQLEGEQGEALLSQFRAQVLTQRIQAVVILGGADDLGLTPTEADIADAREELVEDLGGEDELQEAVDRAGLDEEAMDIQLRIVAVVSSVGAMLREDEDAEELLPEGAPDVEDVSEEEVEQLLFQQWFMGELAEAEVLVDPVYGQWEPQAGQVVPAQQAPVPLPDDEDDEDEE